MPLRWHPWKLPFGHTLVGNIKISTPLKSQYLNHERVLYVYLPPSYITTTQSYPVLYMHDGQNLFDETLSYAGEWQVDETLENLSAEGVEFIVVGIPNAEEDRAKEYTPYIHPQFGGGQGDAYLKFLVEEVKPLIDAEFRTQLDRSATGLMGSSLGGLISLYGLFQYPEVFSFAGAMSPAFWFNKPEIFDFITDADAVGGAIYMDVGSNETPDNLEMSQFYVDDFLRMKQILQEKGYTDHNFSTFLDEDAIHHEREWAKRLPDSFRFWWKACNLTIK